MYFRNYGLLKSRLGKCLRSPVSERPSAVNMLKSPKHCWNLNGSSFIMFSCHYEGNRVGK